MVKKKERLNRETFNRFFSVGKRYHSPSLTLVHHPHDSFHASVVISKKVFKKASLRNRLRRRIYGVLEYEHRVSGLDGVFIVVVKKEAGSMPYHKVSSELKKIIGRIRIKR